MQHVQLGLVTPRKVQSMSQRLARTPREVGWKEYLFKLNHGQPFLQRLLEGQSGPSPAPEPSRPAWAEEPCLIVLGHPTDRCSDTRQSSYPVPGPRREYAKAIGKERAKAQARYRPPARSCHCAGGAGCTSISQAQLASSEMLYFSRTVSPTSMSLRARSSVSSVSGSV